MNCLSPRSVQRLAGVHPDLVKVVSRAMELTTVDFVITEGLRTLARQKQLVAAGASQTLKSRHITGHAIDLAPVVAGQVRWDWPMFFPLAAAMQQASKELNIPIRWGGAWKELSTLPTPITTKQVSKSFPDGPHFELPSRVYP